MDMNSHIRNAVEVWVADIVADKPVWFLEEARLEMAWTLERSGADFGAFRQGYVHFPGRVYTKLDPKGIRVPKKKSRYTLSDADGNSTRGQADFVALTLGPDWFYAICMEMVIFLVEEHGIEEFYKKTDREAGVPKPSVDDIEEYVDYLFGEWSQPVGFTFDTGKHAEGVYWKKNVLYRLEATTSCLYAFLRVLSYEDAMEAMSYQNSGYFKEMFARRLQEGERKLLEKAELPVPEHLKKKDKSIIRHVCPKTFIWLCMKLIEG